MQLAIEITLFDREIRKQKLRREHPEWCELEVINEILRHAFRVKSEPIPEGLENQMQQRVKNGALTKPLNQIRFKPRQGRMVIARHGPEASSASEGKCRGNKHGSRVPL